MDMGLILAGGRSRRYGGEKALAVLGGQSLLLRARQRLADACPTVAVSAQAGSRTAARAVESGVVVLADPPGLPQGPLAGVLAGLIWAQNQGAGRLITLPCDTPLAPGDMIARLLGEMSEADAAVARSPGGLQPLCAAWRTSLAEPLRAALGQGRHPAVHQFLAEAGAVVVDFPDDEAFLNINTPEDLVCAERCLAATP